MCSRNLKEAFQAWEIVKGSTAMLEIGSLLVSSGRGLMEVELVKVP